MPANRFMPNLITEELAFERLLAGGVVAVPTETVYGLACLAESADAVARVFKIKKRPSDNPLICHFHSVSQISAYVQPLSETEKILFDHFSPGPLSLLLRLNENSPLYPATRSGRTVVVRIPAHPVFLSLLKKINKPIAAPSANTSGRYSAVNTQMVLADVGALTDGIIEGGECVNGIESTIVEVSDKQVTILRPGVIGPDDLQDVLQSNEIDVPVRYGTTRPRSGKLLRRINSHPINEWYLFQPMNIQVEYKMSTRFHWDHCNIPDRLHQHCTKPCSSWINCMPMKPSFFFLKLIINTGKSPYATG
jgi:tRNA threonylcarbamoyl adenosine modification protein (Sua5/YciO/YrdC/YwlC family)